jgi:hypothetical protein
LHTVICHDLSRPRTTDAELFGIVRQEDLDLALLRNSLGIDFATLEDFRSSTFFANSWSFITNIVPYQISEALDRYTQEFYEFLCNSFWHVIREKFCKTTDYKEKYEVPSDPILSASELLTCKQPFVNVQTGSPPTLYIHLLTALFCKENFVAGSRFDATARLFQPPHGVAEGILSRLHEQQSCSNSCARSFLANHSTTYPYGTPFQTKSEARVPLPFLESS